MSNININLFYANIPVGRRPEYDPSRFLKVLFFITLIILIIISLSSCKKSVEINQPVNSITTEGAFSTDATATSTVTGIYSNLINTGTTLRFGNGALTLFAGLSSDELSRIALGGNLLQFKQNALLPDNGAIQSFLWNPAYFGVYQTNACLEGLQNSNSLTPALKKQLIGECKFFRAFLYFYLTNIWGDVPMPLTSDWSQTYLNAKTVKTDVYQQIISDLKDAQTLLVDDYSYSNGERIRANKYAATALLARVYLYLQKWVEAETEATAVINQSGIYNLAPNLNDVFLGNSNESILQFQPTNTAAPYAVNEQFNITQPQLYYLTNELLNAFEINDQRKLNWTSKKIISGTTYYYPYKYKIRQGTSGGTISEYYMILRLAEQYLIRAEAKAQQNKTSEAQADLNIIRNRAGLSNTTANDTQSLLLAIEHERQVELFAEWGHRWFDLIRTGRVNTILAPIKGSTWKSTAVLYPIPFAEIQRNPNLSQNPGY